MIKKDCCNGTGGLLCTLKVNYQKTAIENTKSNSE